MPVRNADTQHLSLKLWLRLLGCAQRVESEVRTRLRKEFGISLARFDLLAQLQRAPEGLRMNELSRRLMVTGGNVTGLTDQLEQEGLVLRSDDPIDRRAYAVHLTPAGRTLFNKMAARHEQWIVELFAGVSQADKTQIYKLLDKFKSQSATSERRT